MKKLIMFIYLIGFSFLFCFISFSFLWGEDVIINLYNQRPKEYNTYKENTIVIDYNTNTNEYTVVNIKGDIKEFLIVEMKIDKRGNLVEDRIFKKYENINNETIVIRCPFDKKSLKLKWQYKQDTRDRALSVNNAAKKIFMNIEYEEHLIGESGKFVRKK